MRGIRLSSFDGVLSGRILWCAVMAAALVMLAGASAFAQAGGGDNPVYTAYRGVHIGSTAAEARKSLGDPIDKSDAQDLFVFNEKEIATIYYDKDKKVNAISVDFMGDDSHPPSVVDVMGSTPPAKPDGSTYMMVRYPKAGYWVSYNRTASTPATVSVTMQKMQ